MVCGLTSEAVRDLNIVSNSWHNMSAGDSTRDAHGESAWQAVPQQSDRTLHPSSRSHFLSRQCSPRFEDEHSRSLKIAANSRSQACWRQAQLWRDWHGSVLCTLRSRREDAPRRVPSESKFDRRARENRPLIPHRPPIRQNHIKKLGQERGGEKRKLDRRLMWSRS